MAYSPFYFDMNIFQIFICLAKTLDSPFLSKRLNDGQPATYSIAEPDISSMAWCVIAAVFSLCPLIPCKANAEKATLTTETTAAGGLQERKHRRIAINFAYPLMMMSTIFIPELKVDSSVVTPVRISPTLFLEKISQRNPFQHIA